MNEESTTNDSKSRCKAVITKFNDHKETSDAEQSNRNAY